MKLTDRLTDLRLGVSMATLGRREFARLLRSAQDPDATQKRTLSRIQASLAATAFGRSLGLDRRHDVDAFRKHVPIHSYEALRPWIERQIAGEAAAIAPTPPVMYARTSGTTGAPKLVPVTSEVLRGLRRAQRVMAYSQQREANAFTGKLLAIGGVSREITLPGNVPAGATTGLIYETMPRMMRAKYVVPWQAFGVDDPDLKYATIIRLGLQHRDVSVIATANPSTILRLVDIMRGSLSSMIEDVASGAFAGAAHLLPDQVRAVAAALRPAPGRAAELATVVRSKTPLTLADVWPELKAVVTWTQGSCALAAKAVASMLPPGALLVEAGYVASELRATVVVDARRGLGLPLVDDVFFEFVPVEAWDQGTRETLLLHELEEGRDYQILATTAAGLVRYHMNDVVRATQRIGATSTLAFVRKGRGVTSITGEKVAEDQVAVAVQRLASSLGVAVPFYVFIADEARAAYFAHLQIDADPVDRSAAAALLDESLEGLNIEYAAKRKSGRLNALIVKILSPEAAIAYRRHLVAKGQREAQLKILTLQRAQDCDFDFDAFSLDPTNAA